MLTSQVIYLKQKRGNTLSISGNHIHGLFFKEILAWQTPELADYLHLPNRPKPFSLSYINREGQMYWFRIASWMDEIAQAVFSYFSSHFEVALSDCVFSLAKTSTDKNETPWAGRISIEDFVKYSRSIDRDTFWLEHYSPTSFKCGDTHLALPVPDLIVNSISRQLPPKIREELSVDPVALTNLIQLKEHRIKSVYNRKNYGSIASFVGRTRWQINKHASQPEKDAIRLLFGFAFYSGIGVKTTQGMGMCRTIE